MADSTSLIVHKYTSVIIPESNSCSIVNTPTNTNLLTSDLPTILVHDDSAREVVISLGAPGPTGPASPVESNPMYTYSGSLLTRVDYASGNYKILSYIGTALDILLYYKDGKVLRKQFNYNQDGSLISIEETYT